MEKKWFDTDWIYDLESYPNCLSMTIIHASGKWLRQYEISDRKDDIEELANCLRYLIQNKCRMVGFNNLGYDYHLVHYIIGELKTAKKNGKPANITAIALYKLTKKIIEGMREDGRSSSVKDDEITIPQVDLFKVNHFDNKARATSLKVLEFNMRSENIEDLPFPVGKLLTNEEIDVLLEYNAHDVKETLKFYYYCYDALLLRSDLSASMGWDVTNFNDTKIGKELFIRSLEKENPGVCYTIKGKGRKINQTKRDKIVIKDCLLGYYKFERPEFQAVYEWFKKQVINSTLGVFSDILEHNLGDVAKYAQMEIKRFKINDPNDSKNKRYVPDQSVYDELKKEYPLGWVEEKELKSPKGAKSYYWCYKIAENLNVVIDGYRYDYGVGGIHGAIQGFVQSSENAIIKTYDVASYYPNLAISNNLYPQHLGQDFCKIYKNLYDERKKHAKGTALNAALKLALNGTYGDSNNEFSPLYDPAYTMAITINGQLSLCMLTEKLIKHCDARMLMHNTDGLEFMVHPSQDERVKKVVAWWEKVTGLEMEGDEYEKMFVRDVNSYVSVKKGKGIDKWMEEFIELETK